MMVNIGRLTSIFLSEGSKIDLKSLGNPRIVESKIKGLEFSDRLLDPTPLSPGAIWRRG